MIERAQRLLGAYLPGVALALVVGSASPDSLVGQSRIEGVILEETSGDPLEGVLVKLETNGSIRLTDDDGRFSFRGVPDGSHFLTFSRLGLAPETVEVRTPADGTIEVRMEIDPIDFEGIVAQGVSFEARYEEAETHLDLRLAELPGRARSVGAARIRGYDSLYRSDPWALVQRELGIDWVFEEDSFRWMGRKVRPEVYVDEKRTWLFRILEGQPSSFCRIELYMPPRTSYRLDDRPPQLRAYTCAFLGKVAAGFETLSDYLSTGDLIAGPGGMIDG